jgi:hypothetical protein
VFELSRSIRHQAAGPQSALSVSHDDYSLAALSQISADCTYVPKLLNKAAHTACSSEIVADMYRFIMLVANVRRHRF